MKKALLLFLLLSSLFSKEFLEIEFVGSSKTPFDDFHRDNLLKLLGIEYPPFYKFWKDDPVFHSEDIKTYSERLLEYTKSKGYFGAEVTSKEIDKKLQFTILKGEITVVDSINIDSDINIDVNLTTLNVSKFQDMRESIKEQLLKLGYAQHTLQVKAYVEDNHSNIDIFVRKNELNHFGNIDIDDVPSIDKNIILDEIVIKDGAIYSKKEIDLTYKNLSNLDIFELIEINELNTNSSNIPIHIALRKGKERVFKSYFGLNSDTIYSAKINFLHKNFFGNLKTFEVDLVASSETYSLTNRLFIPKIYKNIALEDILSLESNSYDGYKEEKISNSISLNKKIEDVDSYLGILTEQSKVDYESQNISDGNYFINSIFVKFLLDKRDSKLDPRDGYLLSLYLEHSSTLYKSEFEYIKLLFEGRTIDSFDKFIFANKFKMGFITESLPTFKKFFVGGSFSNRGYEYRKLGELDSNNNPLGGRFMVDYTLEGQYEIYKDIYLALFYDTSILNEDLFVFDNFYNSLGFGIRYKSLIGPIRFDFAKALDGDFAFHFSIGETF